MCKRWQINYNLLICVNWMFILMWACFLVQYWTSVQYWDHFFPPPFFKCLSPFHIWQTLFWDVKGCWVAVLCWQLDMVWLHSGPDFSLFVLRSDKDSLKSLASILLENTRSQQSCSILTFHNVGRVWRWGTSHVRTDCSLKKIILRIYMSEWIRSALGPCVYLCFIIQM